MENKVPEGFEPIELGKGYARAFGPVYLRRETGSMGFRVAEQHLNWVDVCSGGAMATFADMQISAVKSGPGSPERHRPTISMSVDYLAPAPLGSWVEATVEEIKWTGTLLFTQALITADGELVARSNVIYRHYERRASRQAREETADARAD